MHYRSQEDLTMQRVEALMTAMPQLKIGLVTSYDPISHCVKVIYQPEQKASGWIPIASSAVGNNWGLWIPPDMNQQVLIDFYQGDSNSPMVIGQLHSDQNPPGKGNAAINGSATQVQQGEILLVAKTGQVVRLCADGSVYIQAANINLDGNVTISKDLHVMKNIKADKDITDAHGSVDRLRGNYNAHTHSGVQSGGASTSTTSQTDAE